MRRKRPSGSTPSSHPSKLGRHHQPFTQLQHGHQQLQQQNSQHQQQQQPLSDFDKDDHVVIIDVKQEALTGDLTEPTAGVVVDPNGNTLLESLVDAEGRRGGVGAGGGVGGGGGGDGGSRKSGPESDDSDFAEIVEEVQSAVASSRAGDELPLSSLEKALNRVTNSAVAHPNDVIAGR